MNNFDNEKVKEQLKIYFKDTLLAKLRVACP